MKVGLACVAEFDAAVGVGEWFLGLGLEGQGCVTGEACAILKIKDEAKGRKVKLKKSGVVLMSIAVVLGGSIVAAPPAQAAYGSYCTIYAYTPTTNGVTLYSKGSAACSAGHVVGVGTNGSWHNGFGFIDAYATDWKWEAAASLAHTSSWTCNGTGTRTWRVKAVGQNNSGQTGTAYGNSRSLTC